MTATGSTVTEKKYQDSAAANFRLGVAYMPIVDAVSRQIVGYEALARPRDPFGNPYPPQEFVAAVEREARVHLLGEHVLDRVLRRLANWPEFAGYVAVNVSPIHLARTGFTKHLVQLLDEHGVAPDRLALEITESGFLSQDESSAILDRLAPLRERGLKVFLDDFGTGHSSLARLAWMDVDAIKIDRAFLNLVPEHERAARLLVSILRIVHDMGIFAIQEGVETETQREFLIDKNCLRHQGYLYGKAAES